MSDSDFVARCSCGRELMEVQGAANHFLSWNYRHAVGGLTLTCPPCGRDWVLGGHLQGYGEPDLIDAETLAGIDHLPLTRLQRRALDISLVAEDMLWEQEAQHAQAAARAGDAETVAGHMTAAKLMRGASLRERARTLRAILDEHGIAGLPKRLRIARLSDGSGAIYAVDRGPVKKRTEVVEPERVVDLT